VPCSHSEPAVSYANQMTKTKKEHRPVNGDRTGKALVKVLQDSGLQDVSLDRPPTPSPVRAVELGEAIRSKG
jgi:hypothetical protein